jgi:hypothetical protein
VYVGLTFSHSPYANSEPTFASLQADDDIENANDITRMTTLSLLATLGDEEVSTAQFLTQLSSCQVRSPMPTVLR